MEVYSITPGTELLHQNAYIISELHFFLVFSWFCFLCSSPLCLHRKGTPPNYKRYVYQQVRYLDYLHMLYLTYVLYAYPPT